AAPFMRIIPIWLALALLVVATSCRQPITPHSALRIPHSARPGKQPDGSVLLPNQWSLQPVGRQIELGDFPINIAVHPNGRFAAILHSGYSEHEIIVVDLVSARIVCRAGISQAFYGLQFSKDGRRLFCSG